MKSFLNRVFRSKGFSSFIASLVSIVVGLLVGLIVLLFFDSAHAMNGFRHIVTAGLSDPGKLAKVFYQAAPLIMTGL